MRTLFPPGGTTSRRSRSRWREIAFLHRQVVVALLPTQSLTEVLNNWSSIRDMLAEPPRQRTRFKYY
jgi:hypothetical protein